MGDCSAWSVQGVLVGGQSSTLLRRLVASGGFSAGRPGGLWFAAVQRENWPTDPAMLDYLETIWTEEVGDCRLELVVFGVEMDQGAIEAFLDEALVTDDEMSAGPEHWLTFEDPLPSWEHSQPAQD